MALTYEQAKDQAIRLHKQKMTYMKIAEHLKTAGYVSTRTNKPVSYVTVRKMVTEDEPVLKQEAKEAKAEDFIKVSSPKREKLEAAKKILGLEGLSVDTQLDILRAITK